MKWKGALHRGLLHLGLQVNWIGFTRKRTRHSDRLRLYDTATGKYYLPAEAHGDNIVRAIREGGVFDEPIVDLARKFVRPGTIALDVGANFGQMAVMMARLVGPSGKVYAFEADDFVHSVLVKNARLNGSNIEPVFGAVHTHGNDTLYFPVQDFERFQTYGSYGIDYVHGKGRPVKTVAIDDMRFDAPISFMKVDVQGGDLLAMKGAIKTIAEHRMPIVFEYEYLFEEDLNLSFQEYVDFVRDIGYRFARVIQGQNFLILPGNR